MARRRITFLGREIEGQTVPFSVIKDGSVLIETDEGAKLRLKPVILNVVKTGEKNDVGEPMYVVESLVHVSLEDVGGGEGNK